MSFLVTGGTGFIGSRAVHNLVKRGERVVSLDRARQSAGRDQFSSQVTIVEADLGDAGELAAVFDRHPEIDRVVHLAYVMGAEAEADPPTAMRVNAHGTANLFAEACARGVKRILFSSSESVYGKSQAIYGDRPVTEDDFCSPRDHALNYSLTKLLNEHLAGKYEAKSATEIVSLRVAIAYGPGRQRGTTVWASDFASLPALGKPVTLPFPEDDWNCYIYVDDVAEQVYRLMTKPALAHRVYNSGGHTLRARELAALVREIVPGADIEFSPAKPYSPFVYRLDDRRIREEVGFSLRPMREGIHDHIEKARRLGSEPTNQLADVSPSN
jgi:UDP-glucose 4-epimerase